MNYAELKTNVSAWLHRADISASEAQFVELAESRLRDALRLSRFSTVATLTIPAAASAVDVPVDFLEGRALTGSDGEWTLCTPEQLAQRISAGSDDKAYAVIGGQIRIPFTATADIPLTLAYFQVIPALTVSATTNWLLTNHPGCYLWSALAEAATYAQDMKMLQVFEGKSAAAIDAARRADMSGAYFAAALQADYAV